MMNKATAHILPEVHSPSTPQGCPALVRVPTGPPCVCTACEAGQDHLERGLCADCLADLEAHTADGLEEITWWLSGADDEDDRFDYPDLDPLSGIPTPWS